MSDKPKPTISSPKRPIVVNSPVPKNTANSSTKQKPNQKNLAQKSKRPLTDDKAETIAKRAKSILTAEDYTQILGYLQKTYPRCFPPNSTPLPLAVGIHNQIFALKDLPFTKTKIRRFLARYTRSKEYRNNLVVGEPRVNLQGNHAGSVKEEEIDRTKWKEIKAEGLKKANHDSFIKKAFENPLIAQEFLSEYLPDEYKSLIDLSTLKPEKETFVEESLKTRLSDLVFSVKINEQSEDKPKNAFIYALLEHQAYSDRWIALRLLKYSLLLLERHATGKDDLPVVLPLVVYNGKSKYKAPRNIFELFAYPDIARQAMTDDYNLIDLQTMDDEAIDYDKHLSFLLYTMKHIHQRDTLAMLKEAMSRCFRAIIIDKEQNYILTKLILHYTDSKVPEEKKHLLEQLIVDNLSKDEANNIMRTIADSYIEEGFNKGILQGIEKGIEKGREEGIEKGKAELIKMMLNQGNSVDTISKITGLPASEIQKLI